MQKVTTVKCLVKAVKQWRLQGETIAFVPTMGNLHAGHIKLVTEAGKKADKVVVSIFVNPSQFAPGEDFESYPRTEIEDAEKLKKAGADLLFLPTVKEVYQQKMDTLVSVSSLSTKLCGANRPGHFDGVATVVTKLFNMVQPDTAFFGEKDFQQLAVIRALVRDLNIPVKVFAVATEREVDGLALSSRNAYLTQQQRRIAPELYRSLCNARRDMLSKKYQFRIIEKQQQSYLQGLGFKVDYFSICRVADLQQANENEKEVLILVAATLGKPRLIDNLICSL